MLRLRNMICVVGKAIKASTWKKTNQTWTNRLFLRQIGATTGLTTTVTFLYWTTTIVSAKTENGNDKQTEMNKMTTTKKDNTGAEGTQSTPDSQKPVTKTSKRKDVLSWDENFMGVAFMVSQRSKDPTRQVGCCIVNTDNIIVSTGYNGFPNRCSDDKLPWAKGNEDELQNKFKYVCHAEMNAIVHRTSSVKDCTLYTTMFPCNECAKIIVQSGISKVVYYEHGKDEKVDYKASRKILKMADILHVEYFRKEPGTKLKIGKMSKTL